MSVGEQVQQRESRFHFRATADQDALIREAAAATDSTVTDFVLRSAVERAESVLTDRQRLRMSPQAFDRFVAAMDEPARVVPELVELLEHDSIIPDA